MIGGQSKNRNHRQLTINPLNLNSLKGSSDFQSPRSLGATNRSILLKTMDLEDIVGMEKERIKNSQKKHQKIMLLDFMKQKYRNQLDKQIDKKLAQAQKNLEKRQKETKKKYKGFLDRQAEKLQFIKTQQELDDKTKSFQMQEFEEEQKRKQEVVSQMKMQKQESVN